jgi:hypothetical protein
MSSKKNITGQNAEHEKPERDDQRVADRCNSLREVNHVRTAILAPNRTDIIGDGGWSILLSSKRREALCEVLRRARIEMSKKNAVLKDALVATTLIIAACPLLVMWRRCANLFR